MLNIVDLIVKRFIHLIHYGLATTKIAHNNGVLINNVNCKYLKKIQVHKIQRDSDSHYPNLTDMFAIWIAAAIAHSVYDSFISCKLFTLDTYFSECILPPALALPLPYIWRVFIVSSMLTCIHELAYKK